MILGPSWVISKPSCGFLGHLAVVLRLSCAISQCYDFGRRTLHRRFLQNSHLAYTRARFFAFLGATCGLLSPSWRHPETVLRHLWAILRHLGAISVRFGPFWRHFWTSLSVHRRRSRSFRTIRSLPTREYHSVVGLMPSGDDRVESSSAILWIYLITSSHCSLFRVFFVFSPLCILLNLLYAVSHYPSCALEFHLSSPVLLSTLVILIVSPYAPASPLFLLLLVVLSSQFSQLGFWFRAEGSDSFAHNGSGSSRSQSS